MKTVLKYGFFTGIAVSLWLLLSFAVLKSFNVPPDKARAVTGMLSVIVQGIGIYLGINQVKKNNDGSLSYKQAVFTGIKISLIVAVIVSIYALLYCTVINPGYAEFMVKETEKSLVSSGFPPDEIGKKLEGAQQMYSTQMQVMQGFIGQTIMGTFASLILGIFMRTKKQTPN